jgi:hypothetical protein
MKVLQTLVGSLSETKNYGTEKKNLKKEALEKN